MEKHYKIISVLYIVFGILNIIISVTIFFVLEKILEFAQVDQEVIELIRVIGIPIGISIVVLSILSIIGGIALTREYNWAKILILVIGCLYLISFPLGTIIGVYTIVVYISETQQRSRETIRNPNAPSQKV